METPDATSLGAAGFVSRDGAPRMNDLYGVFAISSAGDFEFLAVYSTRERARRLIEAQPEYRRAQMRIVELQLDAMPPTPATPSCLSSVSSCSISTVPPLAISGSRSLRRVDGMQVLGSAPSADLQRSDEPACAIIAVVDFEDRIHPW
jgi:hypothetical protein